MFDLGQLVLGKGAGTSFWPDEMAIEQDRRERDRARSSGPFAGPLLLIGPGRDRVAGPVVRSFLRILGELQVIGDTRRLQCLSGWPHRHGRIPRPLSLTAPR